MFKDYKIDSKELLDECFNFDFKQARILEAIEKKKK